METPVKRVLRSQKLPLGTPLNIPATPLLHRLGYGTGVEVYRVQRSPALNKIKSPWAVKRITKRALANGDTELYTERLQKEAKILRQLKNPHIVGFRGLTKDESGRDVLALEICTMSLMDLIDKRSEEGLPPIPSKSTMKVIVDVATALDYLHNTAKILHGDIKSANVLINGDFEICKLCDFGVALPLDKNGLVDRVAEPYAQYVGTELWAAPEVFDEDTITTKTDIFAFGCTVYEMLSLIAPHLGMDLSEVGDNRRALDFDDEDSENNDSLNQAMQQEQELEELIEERKGTRPLLPDDIELDQSYDRAIEIYYICTSKSPDQRPSAKDILEQLK